MCLWFRLFFRDMNDVCTPNTRGFWPVRSSKSVGTFQEKNPFFLPWKNFSRHKTHRHHRNTCCTCVARKQRWAFNTSTNLYSFALSLRHTHSHKHKTETQASTHTHAQRSVSTKGNVPNPNSSHTSTQFSMSNNFWNNADT